jgi:hypothetical protein
VSNHFDFNIEIILIVATSKLPQIPLVDFINVLQAAFTFADPKSVKKTDFLTVFCALSGSAHVKAAHRTLMKLTPCVSGILKNGLVYGSKQFQLMIMPLQDMLLTLKVIKSDPKLVILQRSI